jgi:hypothetical protein
MPSEDISGKQNNTGAYYFQSEPQQMTCPLVVQDLEDGRKNKGGLFSAFSAETNRPVMVNGLGFSSRNNDSGPTHFHGNPD